MKKVTNGKSNYLPIISVLRGLAALAVCMFHFRKGFVNESGFVGETFRFGWMGVEVFFVISGFVLPYSLLGTKFKVKHFPKFLKKRLIRLEPAYLISILVVIILNYLSTKTPGFQGEPFQVSFILVLEHIGYLVGLLNDKWLNPVYWTLEIEFHYYLVVGLFIALWNYDNKWLTLISLIGLFSLSILDIDIVPFFNYADIFLLGIVTAFFKKEKINKLSYILSIILIGVGVFYNHGLIIFLLTQSTSILIIFFSQNGNNKALLFFGNISYSLYLLHVPIGGRVINLAKRFDFNEYLKLGVIIIALGVSIFAAWLFYKFIEKPSHEKAKQITFK